MVIERIDKTDRLEPWKVQEATAGQRSRQESDSEELAKDAYASLHDKTDWQILFSKDKQWKTNIQVLREEIEKITFKKVNLKTDPSLLRIDIELKGGEKISPAFLAVSRVVGLKIKNLKPGDSLPPEVIMQGQVLRVTIPANPKLFLEREEKIESQQTRKPPPSDGEPTEDPTIRKGLSPTLLERLKIQDPVTQRLRADIVFIYGITLALFLALLGGIFLIT